MPIYAIACPHCGAQQDIFRKVAEYDDLPICCDSKMQRRLTVPFVQADIQPYQSMVTGEMITSRSMHKSHLKQHRMTEIGNEVQKIRTDVHTPGDLKQDIANVINGYGG